MLSCREVTRLVASDELATAHWRRRFAVRLHQFLCRHCRRYMKQLQSLGSSTRKALDAEIDTAAVERLEREIVARLPDAPDESATE